MTSSSNEVEQNKQDRQTRTETEPVLIQARLYAVISDAGHTPPLGHPQCASGVKYQNVSTTYDPYEGTGWLVHSHKQTDNKCNKTRQELIFSAGTVPEAWSRRGNLKWEF